MEGVEDCPPLENIDNKEDEDSDEWEEMEVKSEQTTCLFCPLQFHTIAVALDHCRTEHNFDLLSLKNKYNMDCYSYIKMINFIRLQKPDPKMIIESNEALWENEAYLKPGEMESWLMYDFDDLGSAPSTPHFAIDGKPPISNMSFSDMKRQIHQLTVELQQKNLMLQNAMQDIEKMKQVTRNIVENDDSVKEPNIVASIPVNCDGDYFNSYSHFGIHYDMLNDKVRTCSYRDAILNNPNTFNNKTVLDVGCGTGILSMFSAKAGASQVIGIDQSNVVYKAMDIIRENNLEDKIQLIKGRLENTNLPIEKVDIIVSEWMGYFLLFEGMLDSFVYARDRHLAENGKVLPNRSTISIAGVSDIDHYNNIINFWDDVYGFSMKCMKSDVINEAFVETVPADKVFTNSVTVTDIDLMTCTTNACEFSSKFQLKASRDGDLTALVGYFDIFFELENPVQFSTSPSCTKTHWQQTVFYLKEVIPMKEGEEIEGKLSCTRLKKNFRGLGVTITIGSKKYEYFLD